MSEMFETIAPTKQRLAKVKSGLRSPTTDQKQSRRAWQIVSIVETMFSNGRISAECRNAFDRFVEDWVKATYHPSRISQYGTQAVSRTPLSQMTDDAIDKMSVADDAREFAKGRVSGALNAVGGLGRDALMLAMREDLDMQSLGVELSGYRGKMQAQAAAAVILRDALYRLHIHYDEG